MGPYASGPGGIRTRDLISAIDARSHLRHRPPNRVTGLYLTESMTVKQTPIQVDLTVATHILHHTQFDPLPSHRYNQAQRRFPHVQSTI
jgi:hypothetical protein